MAARLIAASVGVAVLAAASGAVSAKVTEYTNPTAYGAATSNSTTVNFDGLTAPGTSSLGDVTLGGLNFSAGDDDFPLVVGSGLGFFGGSAFFTGASVAPGVDPSEVLCTLAGSTAIGFLYGDFDFNGGLPLRVTINGDESFDLSTPPIPGVDTGFVGFVSDSPITSIRFSDDGEGFALLEVEQSSSSPVGAPEPATTALLVTGLLSLAVLTRRRPRRHASRLLNRSRVRNDS